MKELSQTKELNFSTSAFTTHAKKHKTSINISRKGSIVKERCRQLVEIIVSLYPDGFLPDDDLQDLVKMYIGADKETVRAYCGYYGNIRTGRCGDSKIVGLSRKGYLEIFGFLRKAGSRYGIRYWGLVQTFLSESPISSQANLKESVSNNVHEKISISLSSSGKARETSESVVSAVVVSSSKREEEEATEKERNFTPMIYGDSPKKDENLLFLEQLAKATSCGEPDKAKTNLGER
jgi:hypothetical protein